MVQNCCDDDITMQELYLQTLALDRNDTWDFSKWVPQAVVINLGTNDAKAHVSISKFELRFLVGNSVSLYR
jgi:hypothetical protein